MKSEVTFILHNTRARLCSHFTFNSTSKIGLPICFITSAKMNIY